jgi:hypothetical protein
MDANSKALGWGSSNSHVITREVFHNSRTTTAMMEFSFVGVIGVYGQTSFQSAVGVTIPVSGRRCFNYRNTLTSA